MVAVWLLLVAAPGAAGWSARDAHAHPLLPAAPPPCLPLPPKQKVDIWGAGIVLYALLYGQLPYELHRPDIFADHDERRRPPPPHCQARQGVPREGC